MYYIYIYLYISQHKHNAHIDGNRAQPLKRLLETLFLATKKSTGFTTENQPTQSSSRRVSSLKDSSVLLTTEC